MSEINLVFDTIRKAVLQVLPEAEVVLFGSRAGGTATPESDWDILILSHLPVTRNLKNKVHRILFPVSVDIAAFINFTLVNRNDWEHHPAYYSLRTNLMHAGQAGSY